MLAGRLRTTATRHAVAAVTLIAAWVTVLAGNVAFYQRCEVDCGDGGARGLFLLLVMLVPAAALGVRFLGRGGLSQWGRLLAKLNGVLLGFLAISLAPVMLPDPLWFFGVAVPVAVVAAACWQLGRAA